MILSGFGFGFISDKVLFLSTVLFQNCVVPFFFFIVVETETLSGLEPAK